MRNGARKWLWILLAGVFLMVLLMLPWRRDRAPVDVGKVRKATKSLKVFAQTGDLIFTEGDSFESDVVRLLGTVENGVSHIGILQKRADGLYVTHMSYDDGMIMSELIDTFFVRSRVAGFHVRRTKTDFDRERLAVVLDSLLLLGKRFDYTYSMNDGEEYYCTELICEAYRQAGFHELEGIQFKHVLYPVEIMLSPALDTIPNLKVNN